MRFGKSEARNPHWTSPRDAIMQLPGWMRAVLECAWDRDAGVSLAGGFPASTIGRTTGYEDIDLFVKRYCVECMLYVTPITGRISQDCWQI